MNPNPTTTPEAEELVSQVAQLKADIQTVSEKIQVFQLSYAVTVGPDQASQPNQPTPQPDKPE